MTVEKSQSYVCVFRQEEEEGQLESAVIGDAKFDPTSLADIDQSKSEDMKRPSAAIDVLEDVIPDPGNVHLEDAPNEPQQKRVSMTEEKLR